MNSRRAVQKEIGHRLAGSGTGSWKEDLTEEKSAWKTERKGRWEGRRGREIERRERRRK
jgi:hypothetical protein